jgi:NADP-dependent aldehyde dehydrogenase
MHTDLATWKRHPAVHTEIFGPAAILIDGFPGRYKMPDPLKAPIEHEAHLVASFHFEAEDIQAVQRYLRTYDLAGRLVFNGVPTGVRVAPGMVHGGPFPSTNRPDTTAVGPLAIERWCRPVCFQNCPQDLLPPELRDVEQK